MVVWDFCNDQSLLANVQSLFLPIHIGVGQSKDICIHDVALYWNGLQTMRHLLTTEKYIRTVLLTLPVTCWGIDFFLSALSFTPCRHYTHFKWRLADVRKLDILVVCIWWGRVKVRHEVKGNCNTYKPRNIQRQTLPGNPPHLVMFSGRKMPPDRAEVHGRSNEAMHFTKIHFDRLL